MPRRAEEDDDPDEDGPEWDDEEEESADVGQEEEEEATVACPYCKRPIYEDAERCPYCGQYVSDEDAPPTRKPWWIIVGVLACLYVVYRWVWG